MRRAYGLDMMVNGFVAAIRRAHVSARAAEERETRSSLSVGK